MDRKDGQKPVGDGRSKDNGSRPPREAIAQSAERWLARNRSLVLRQTPVWAQSLAAILVGLGVSAVTAGLLFRIDEVITVKGQLESLSGSVDVKTPAGGKIAEVLFQDGSFVQKGQLLIRFDTQQATANQATSKRLIELERSELANKLNILKGRASVLQKKVDTNVEISQELSELVKSGGFQRVQYLQQIDQLYELQNQLASINLEMNRSKLEAEKSIGQLVNQLTNGGAGWSCSLPKGAVNLVFILHYIILRCL